jgi:hypothetical protein
MEDFLMLEHSILVKARAELARLNNELHALHLEEERCKLRRSRLEGEKTRIAALVDLCELVQCLHGPAVGECFTIPGGKGGKAVTFHIEDCHGAKLAVADKPAQPSTAAPSPPPARSTLKPEGTPTVRKMVAAALEDAASRGLHQLRPRDITEYIRKKWWPSVESSSVTSTVWRMAKDGKLHAENGRYGLVKSNGAAGDSTRDHWEDLYA